MTAVLSILVSTLVLGALYAALASGLALIWSTVGVFNYAHGALLMLSAYVAWTLAEIVGVPIVFTIILTMAVMALVGVVFEWVLVTPFIRREGGTLQIMVVTLAAATALQGAAQLIWGSTNRQIKGFGDWSAPILGQVVGAPQTILIVVAPVLVAAVAVWLRHSRTGTQIRAVEQNPELARLIGISPRAVYMVVFGIAVALAGVAGTFYGSIYFLTPTAGGGPLLTAFVILVLGGTRSLFGTMIAAYLVGAIESTSNYLFGLQWTPVIVFGMMIVVMLVRPEGIISRKGRAV